MNDEMNGDAEPIQRHADGLDQERHIHAHDFDDGVRAMPAMAIVVGVEDVQLRAIRVLLGMSLDELPMRDHRAQQRLEIALSEIVGGRALVVCGCEAR